MFVEFSPRNPFRTVDWRWRLASLLQEGIPPRRRRRYDTWVRAAATYQERCDAPRRRRHDPLAAVAAAHRLWSGADERLRHEVELRLLAGQTYGDVAARSGATVEVVEAYERLFYNIIERLRCLDYVTLVVDPTVSVLLGEPPLEVVLKKLAYGYGPAAADVLVGFLDGQGPVGIDPGLDRALRRLIVVLRVPVNEATALSWLRLDAIVAMLDRETVDDLTAPLARPVVVAGELPADVLDRLAISTDRAPLDVAAPGLGAVLLNCLRFPPRDETGTGGGRLTRFAVG